MTSSSFIPKLHKYIGSSVTGGSVRRKGLPGEISSDNGLLSELQNDRDWAGGGLFLS